MQLFLGLIFLQTWPGSAFSAPGPRPFRTDGCTAFVDGFPGHPGLWRHCCEIHDLYLWAGGCRKYRKPADERLRDCISATGARKTAWLMYVAVRAGSHSPIKLPGKSWGNAWQDGRSARQPLSMEDLQALRSTLESHPSGLPSGVREDFYRTLGRQIQDPSGCSDSRRR